jgi:exopolyphosphatase/guanosine-5'-triphosphate,3'-diphosphate pyrophosphatase
MGTKGHQKSSLRLILNNQTLPFTCEERYIVGSIARYHRKALPNRRHFNLKSLGQEQRKKVIVLASILRLADALDCSHKSVVKKVKLQLSQSNIVLECLVAGQNYLEDQSVSKKKDLFERVFDKDLTVVWRSKRPTKEKRSSSLTRIQELPVDQHLTPVISPPI